MNRMSRTLIVLVPLALGEGCVLLAEQNNNDSASDLLILSLVGAPCFGLLFFALPALIIGSVIAAIRHPR